MFVCCFLTSVVETAVGISMISIGVRTVISIVSICLWVSFPFGHLLFLNRSFRSKSIGYWVAVGVGHIIVTIGGVWSVSVRSICSVSTKGIKSMMGKEWSSDSFNSSFFLDFFGLSSLFFSSSFFSSFNSFHHFLGNMRQVVSRVMTESIWIAISTVVVGWISFCLRGWCCRGNGNQTNNEELHP